MTDEIQSVIVLAIVVGAVIYLARRGRSKKACSKSDCGCIPKKPGSFK